MTSAPPGWKPHQIVTRVDGWIVDPENEDRIPAAVAEIISRAMGQVGGDTVADVRARMLARHKKVVGYV
jgi:hypothetical protein